MALNGTITGTVTNKSDHFSFYLVWSAEQSISENCSYVTVTSYWATNNRAYTFDTVGTRTAWIDVNGDRTTISQRFTCNPWASDGVYAVQTVSRVKVAHGDGGTKTITVSASADGTANGSSTRYGPSYDSSKPCTASASITLDEIARYAKITLASDFTDLENPTINYSNPLGDSVTSLDACISFTGSAADVTYRSINKTGSSYTFNLTDAERDILRNGTPQKTRTLKFVVRTVYGGNTFTDTSLKTLTIEDSASVRPSASYTIEPISSLPAKFSGLYVQRKTGAKVTLTITNKYNATTSYMLTRVGGKSHTTRVSYFNPLYEGSDTELSIWVKDSRGHSTIVTGTVPVIAYSAPKILPLAGSGEVLCYRSDSSGNPNGESNAVWIKAMKSYASVNGLNGCRMRWRSRLSTSESYGGWTEVTTANDVFNGLISGSFSATEAYSIQIGVVDDIGEESTLTFDIPAFKPVLHLGEGGTGIGIGRYADPSRSKCATVADDWMFDFAGGFMGHNIPSTAGDIYQFAVNCKSGITSFFTTTSTTSLPATEFNSGAGIVIKSNSNNIVVILISLSTSNIVKSCCVDGEWSDWDIIMTEYY